MPQSLSFELEYLSVELGRIARTRGVRLVVHDEIDSTNEEAKRLMLGGERGPLWIVAGRQSQGRGRLGRGWESSPGNLYATLLLSEVGRLQNAPQLGFVAGVAAIEALKSATGLSERLALKWPNDILLDGAKLAGILLEAAPTPIEGAEGVSAIVGFGINCASAPKNTPYPATALADCGLAAPSAPMLFSLLSDAMISALDLWESEGGFQSVRAQWLSQAAGLGENIRVALTNETIEGRFETIDVAGRLKITTHRGERVVEAGDVFLPLV
jgi:BirA family biotin operon repressor/biotin-[acetyl-CoA-carboxylase] ligase